MSLEDDLRAAGFNAADYNYLRPDRERSKELEQRLQIAERNKEQLEQLLIERQRQAAQSKLMKQKQEQQRRGKDITDLTPRHIAALRTVATSTGDERPGRSP